MDCICPQYAQMKNNIKKLEKEFRVTWNCNALSVTEIFCWLNKQFRNLKMVWRNVPTLATHNSCYDTLGHVFSNVWWICTLRFT